MQKKLWKNQNRASCWIRCSHGWDQGGFCNIFVARDRTYLSDRNGCLFFFRRMESGGGGGNRLAYHLQGKYPVVRLVGGEASDGELPLVLVFSARHGRRLRRVLLHPSPNQIQRQLHAPITRNQTASSPSSASKLTIER